MKEIWIEKLIELLNEYLNDKVGYIQYHNEYWFKRTKTKYEVEWERFLQDEYVLGKKFWFIKWLVENEKVNPYDPSYNVPTHIALWVDDWDSQNSSQRPLLIFTS